MNKEKMYGATVAFTTTLVMWVLSNTQFYGSVSKNYFVLALLLFATTMIIGIGFSYLFYIEKKDKVKKTTSHKPSYNNPEDFLGNSMMRNNK